jgi:hypothetical protein
MSMIVAIRTLPGPTQFIDDFDRITRRSMDLIVKWSHENWAIVQNVFSDERFCPIARFMPL